ncbi:MAG TPA: hypothetical protein VMT27_08980 [Actinomycetes bacterium]|nr:hypothetical protein [Actinomycetes bacterium]
MSAQIKPPSYGGTVRAHHVPACVSSLTLVMEIIERAPLHLVGPSLTAGLGELPEVVGRLWRRAFELADDEDTVFAELSEDPGDGTRVIAVGRLMSEPTEDSALVPGGRWVHHEHHGPVADTGDSFGAMFDFADAQGETVGAVTLDVGYERDGEEHVHQLYVQLV